MGKAKQQPSDTRQGTRQRGQRWVTCWYVFLTIAGAILIFVVGFILLRVAGTILGAIAPALPVVGWVLLGLLAFLVLAGLAWVMLRLYGLLQEQLQKRDNRTVVRMHKDERVAVRHRTGHMTMLWDGTPSRVIDAHRAPSPVAAREHYPIMPPHQEPSYFDTQSMRDDARTASPGDHPQAFPSVPQVVTFAQVRGSVRPGQVLIGMRPTDGTLRMGTWEDAKTILVLGSMASGKTNTIAEKTGEAAQGGAFLVVCDPHAHKPDSLYRRVAPLAALAFPGTHFAVTHEDILANMICVRQELERRVQGGRYHRPLVVVIDEWNRLQRDEAIAEELMLIVETLGQEGRGFGIYAIIGAQRITYNVDLRKSVVSAIVHRVDESEARLVIPQRYARYAPELPNGMAFVRDADGFTERLQQALITSRDIQLLLEDGARVPLPHTPKRTVPLQRETLDLGGMPQTFANSPKRGERPVEARLVRLLPAPQTPFETRKTPHNISPKRLNVSPELRAQIIALAQAGMSRRKIKDHLGLHGARYEIVRQVLDDAGL